MVREANLNDVQRITELAKEFFESSTYTKLSYSAKKVEVLVTHAIISDHMVCFVAEESDEIVGFIGGMMIEPHFSTDIVAHEIAWFLKPEYRKKSRAGLLLLRAFERWAKDQGCDIIHYSLLQSSPVGAEELLKRNDCSMVEIGYQKRL